VRTEERRKKREVLPITPSFLSLSKKNSHLYFSLFLLQRSPTTFTKPTPNPNKQFQLGPCYLLRVNLALSIISK
jgi:hypothetical protein